MRWTCRRLLSSEAGEAEATAMAPDDSRDKVEPVAEDKPSVNPQVQAATVALPRVGEELAQSNSGVGAATDVELSERQRAMADRLFGPITPRTKAAAVTASRMWRRKKLQRRAAAASRRRCSRANLPMISWQQAA